MIRIISGPHAYVEAGVVGNCEYRLAHRHAHRKGSSSGLLIARIAETASGLASEQASDNVKRIASRQNVRRSRRLGDSEPAAEAGQAADVSSGTDACLYVCVCVYKAPLLAEMGDVAEV